MPDLRELRVYVDANVLYSAARDELSALRDLWRLRAVTPVTSFYAIGEVQRHLESPLHSARFDELLARTGMVSDADIRFVPAHVDLASKDRPILAAAIFASVDYLVTGDVKHFGKLYRTSVAGVTILRTTDFLARHNERLIS